MIASDGLEHAADNRATSSLLTALDHAERTLASNFPSKSSFFGRIGTLKVRFSEGRLQLAALGQFKRGKSTFLNALMGVPLLPTAVVPITAIPTYLAWGSRPSVRVSYLGDIAPKEFHPADADAIRDLAFRFVAEEANPKNRLNVSRVDIFYPAPILEGGTVLIDTPGVASTYRHNTDMALEILPECDAALFVVSVDPPITEGEIAYIHQIRPHVARMFFILNKIDYLQESEREIAAKFLRGVLEEHRLLDGEHAIFQASARFGLAAKQARSRSALVESGIAELEDHLLRYLEREKSETLRVAIAGKGAAIMAEASAELALRLRALEMPIATLDVKAQAFDADLKSTESQRIVARDILAGERRRLVDELEARCEQLRRDMRERLVRVLDAAMKRGPTSLDSALQGAVSAAVADSFDRALREAREFFVRLAGQRIDGHRRRIEELIDSVRRTASALFELPLSPASEGDPIRVGQEPYWIFEKQRATLMPDLGPAVDRILPSAVRRNRQKVRIERQIDQLVAQNVENLRWSILRGLDETFRHAATRLEARLDEGIDAIRSAIESARSIKRARSDAIEPEIARLRADIASLSGMQAELAEMALPVTAPDAREKDQAAT
jgi:GTPase Era involved in 16S rRNA processing